MSSNKAPPEADGIMKLRLLRSFVTRGAAAQRPGIFRLDDHTVEARVGRQADVVKWLLGTGLDMA